MRRMLAVLLMTGAAAADIGPKPRQYAPGLEIRKGDMEGINVEMSAEDVKLTLKATGEERHEQLIVDVDFDMTNLGEEATFEEGFPIGPVNNMTEFRVTIDGKPADFELVDVNEGKSVKDRRPHGRDEYADYWYVWTAKFPAKAKSRHQVHYVVDLHHRMWEIVNTSYILHTGAPWKNAIGRATVTLRLDGIPAANVWALAPVECLKREKDVWTWTHEGLEPTEDSDIRIRYSCAEAWEDHLAERRPAAKDFIGARMWMSQRLLEAASRQGRAQMTDAELTDACSMLKSCLEGASLKDGTWIVPIEPGAKYPTTAYSWGEFLYETFPGIVSIAEAHPKSPLAQETLRAWTPIAAAMAEDKLGTGKEPAKVQKYQKESDGPKFNAALEKAKKLVK